MTQPYISPSLSHVERVHSLPKYIRLDDYPFILDMAEELQSAPDPSDICGSLDEAAEQYPDEDFLQPVIDRVAVLAKRLRGDNAQEARDIAALLDTLQGDQVRGATEYGLECLASAGKQLRGG